MAKKAKKANEQGTYALCITVGLMVGIGLGPLMGSVLITALVGAALGALAGYLFTQRAARRKRSQSR